MSRKTKVVLGVVVVFLVGVVGLTLLSGGDRGAEVRLAEVEERDLISTVTATGKIRARRAVEISSDVMGRVTRLAVDEGDEVEQGDILLEIDRTQFEAAVSRAEASLSQARSQVAQEEANLLQAERDLGRVSTLWESGPVVSRQDLDDAETRVEVHEALLSAARFGVDQAEASLAEARNELNNTTIRAPMTGTVTRRDIDEGETAVVGTMNNPGSLLLTVSDLATVEAVMTVDETDLPAISEGDSARVGVDAFPGNRLGGSVTKIGNSAVREDGAAQQDGGTVEFEVIVELGETDVPLRPDLSGTADIITNVRENALAVPIIAVTVRDPDDLDQLPETEEPVDPDDPDEPAPVAGEPGAEGVDGPGAGSARSLFDDEDEPVEGVFVVRDGIAHFTPVEVGITGREHFEVLSGLSAGDTVVQGPYQTIRNLRDGDPVRAMGQGN